MANRPPKGTVAFLVAAFVFASAQAATLTVNTTADPSLGGSCTLRDAINSVNGAADSGGCVAVGSYGSSDAINFTIAGAGVHTIALGSSLPAIAKPVKIDGYSQPGAVANTNAFGLGSNGTLLIEIDATNVGNGADTGALTVGPGGGGTTIQGLVINRYVVNGIALVNSGGSNTIQGNYIGINAAGTAALTSVSSASGIELRGFNGGTEESDIIGGTTAASRNVIAGNNGSGQIRLESGTSGAQGGVQIFGNFIGTNAAGTASLSITGCASSAQAGVRVIAGWSGVGIGAAVAGGGNLISGNCARGISLGNDAAINGTIDGNLIGTDATGTVALGNQAEAIELFQVGSFAIRLNIIAASINTANNATGIDINGVTAPTLIQGNRIGTDLTGTLNLGNQGAGIAITSTNGVQIVSNIIAFNGCCQLGGMPGVQINSGTSNAITTNKIFGNAKLGIDLAPIGVVNANNTVTSANNGQNYPVITSAVAGGGSVNIQGTLDAAANANYELDFFSNAACDPLGNGQGGTFLGSNTVATDGSGHATILSSFPLSGGSVVTSTATKVVSGITTDTSEFSACLTATGSTSPPTISKSFGPGSIALNASTSLSFTISNPNGSTLTGVGFTDTLPAGLVVSTPNGFAGSCGGGTVTATAGSGSVSLAGATLGASASCSFSVNVTGTTAGTKNNTTGAITSVEGGSGSTASASVTVNPAIAPPNVAKSFGAASIVLNGSTSLTFTITNPNASSVLSGINLNDALPAGLVVSTPNGLVDNCGGVSAVAGSGTISLVDIGLAANASCTYSVGVTGTSVGTKNNQTDAVTSDQGTGGTAFASLVVTSGGPPPPPSATQPIPTLQQSMLWLLSLILLVAGGIVLARRKSN